MNTLLEIIAAVSPPAYVIYALFAMVIIAEELTGSNHP